MKTEATAVREAQDDLEKALGKANSFYKAGSYDDLTIEPLRLQTTYKEAKLLFFERSIVRPAFAVDEEKIVLPILFFKADGEDQQFRNELHSYRQKHNKEVLMYSSFLAINHKAQSLKSNKVDNTALEQRDEIKYLAPAKKEHFLKVLAELEEWRQNYALTLSADELIATAFDSKEIIKAFHFSNAEQTPAKLIINDNQKNSLNDYALVRFCLAHLLGFDVCVLAKNSYASIENYLPAERFDHFVVPDMPVEEPKKGLFAWFKKK